MIKNTEQNNDSIILKFNLLRYITVLPSIYNCSEKQDNNCHFVEIAYDDHDSKPTNVDFFFEIDINSNITIRLNHFCVFFCCL